MTLAKLDTRTTTTPHGDPILASLAAEAEMCPECRHYRSDCICWYIAEERERDLIAGYRW